MPRRKGQQGEKTTTTTTTTKRQGSGAGDREKQQAMAVSAECDSRVRRVGHKRSLTSAPARSASLSPAVRAAGVTTRSQSSGMRRQAAAATASPPDWSRQPIPDPVMAGELDHQLRQHPELIRIGEVFPTRADVMKDRRQTKYQVTERGVVHRYMTRIEYVPYFHRKKEVRHVKRRLRF